MATAANMRVVPAPGTAPVDAAGVAAEAELFASLLASGEGGVVGDDAPSADAPSEGEVPEENLLAGLLAIAAPVSASTATMEGTQVLPSAPPAPQPQALSLDGRGLGEGGADAGLGTSGMGTPKGEVTNATASSANATPPQPLPIKGWGFEVPTASQAPDVEKAEAPTGSQPVPAQVAAQLQPASLPQVAAQAISTSVPHQVAATDPRKPAPTTDLLTATRPLEGAPVWLSALSGTVTANPIAAPATAPVLDMPHNLDLADDGVWIDQLARDIAGASGSEGPMRFRLSPEHLGRLQVELRQGEEGASLRLTTETEAARAILVDSQPKLAAEARAQGLRLAETHVDLAGGQSGGQGRASDQNRQPALRTAGLAANPADAPADTGPRAERYA